MKRITKNLSLLLVTFALVMCMSFVSSAATYYVTNRNVNMRRQPTTKSNVMLTLPENSVVTYISHSNGWYKVCYQNNAQEKFTGYVSGWYLAKADTYKTSASTNMRKLYRKASALVKKIPGGATVVVRDSYTGNYYKVDYFENGKVYRGYVCHDYLRKVGAKTGSHKTTTAVYMHKNPFMESTTVCVVPKGKTVNVIDFKHGKWYKCTYKSGSKTYTGYISNFCLKKS